MYVFFFQRRLSDKRPARIAAQTAECRFANRHHWHANRKLAGKRRRQKHRPNRHPDYFEKFVAQSWCLTSNASYGLKIIKLNVSELVFRNDIFYSHSPLVCGNCWLLEIHIEYWTFYILKAFLFSNKNYYIFTLLHIIKSSLHIIFIPLRIYYSGIALWRGEIPIKM